MIGLLFLIAVPSYARVRVGIGLWFPWYWAPYPYPYPYPYQAPTTVVVQQPTSPSQVMIPDPQAMQVRSTEDYTKMLADFHSHMETYRNLLKRQLTKKGISKAQYDSNLSALDIISHDEHEKAVKNNGSLSGDQIVDITQQLEKVHQQILKDLSS